MNADIYGLELESIIRPSRAWTINMGASYLHTKVSQDKFLSNPRDPSGGRADAVIIKDITDGSNCAAVSQSGSVAGVNGFVAAINNSLGLRAPTSFGADSGLAANGAFGICSVLEAQAATATGAAFGGVQILNAGVAVNIKGNKLPQAPNYKFSVGTQYTAELTNGMSVVPRVDLTYTGDSYGNIFNGRINKVAGYAQANAQIQLNGQDEKWYVRGFIQNIFDSQAVADSQADLAWLDLEQARYAEASEKLRRALATSEKTHGRDHKFVAGRLRWLAATAFATGNQTECDALLARELAILRAQKTQGDPTFARKLEA